MMQALALSGALILALLVLNSFLNYVCGYRTAAEHGKVMEGTITVVLLYLAFLMLFGGRVELCGIPFVDKLDAYGGLRDMFRNAPQVFVSECAELIALTFVMSYVSRLLPSGAGGSGFTGAVIGRMILVLAGLAANHFLMEAVEGTPLFRWGVTALECFLAGTALAVTPAMVIGAILDLDPQNGFVAFLVKKLPESGVGKALSTAFTNSLVFLFAVMALESQYGSVVTLMRQAPAVIAALAPCVLMLVGIGLMVRSATR